VDAVEENIRRRKAGGSAQRVAQLYADYVHQKEQLLRIQERRNAIAREGAAAQSTELQAKGKALKEELADAEQRVSSLYVQLEAEAARIPNSTHPDAPVGGEEQARVLKLVGEKPHFSFAARDHIQIGRELDLFDWEGGANVAGSQFTVLKNEAALLELALVNWSMQRLVAKGFVPVLAPDLVQSAISEGCGFQPRDREETSQTYHIQHSSLCLAATAEIPCAGLVANRLLSPAELPLKLVAFGHAFRTEAGAAGAATRGLYRIHQFSKVEMFVACAPQSSEGIHQELMDLQIQLFSELGLHFRVLDMPTEDLGASAYRKVDIEAWMPGRNAYGEISSASNCTDYQSRRLNVRFKDKAAKQTVFVHTLNGTGCAVPRVLLALLENGQRADGSVSLPACLEPFLGFRSLSADSSLAAARKGTRKV